jgi:hypothetical protein
MKQLPDNGILAQVPGEFTGAAAMSLPRADSVARDAVLTVDVEAAHVGWVRLSFTPKLAKHRRHRHWYWSAFRADAAEDPQDGISQDAIVTRLTAISTRGMR